MAELRSSTSIGGNLAWHSGNLRFDTQGNTIRFAGYKLYSENDLPTSTELNVVSKDGDTMNGPLAIKTTTGGSAALEIGNTDGTASTPYIDFHAGATTTDYDARIIAATGTGTTGAGTLEVKASNVTFTKITVPTLAGTTITATTVTAPTFTGSLVGNSSTATKLATARTLTYTGHATGSGTYDGSANTSIALTLAASGASAGTYKSVTVDTYGRVTAGTNPTTLSGYGITDALNLAGGTLTGALAGTYFKTNDAAAATNYGDANYGFYVYGSPSSSISYGMTLIDPAANGQWGTNIFASSESSRFVYFSKKTGAGAAYTNFTVAAKVDVATGEIYAAGGTKQVLHTGNYTTTLDSRYVQKTGDSMTGTLTTPEVVISGTAGGTSITKGTIDGATSASANVQFKSWYGIGFAPTISGQTVPVNENAVWINVRNGQLNARGTITAPTFVGSLSGNATTATTADNALLLNGLDSTGFSRAYSASHTFGGSATGITTAEFVTILTNLGAFNQAHWVAKGSWQYSYNNYITDTGFGYIQLAGATVEVIGNSTTYTIRIHTAPTISIGGSAINGDFVYVNHGASYSPAWHRIYSTSFKPSAADVGALSLSGGTITGNVYNSLSGVPNTFVGGNLASESGTLSLNGNNYAFVTSLLDVHLCYNSKYQPSTGWVKYNNASTSGKIVINNAGLQYVRSDAGSSNPNQYYYDIWHAGNVNPISKNTGNVLGNSGFGVGFLSANDAGAQWIAGYFGKNGGANQVVVGELGGNAVIGAHNETKTAWADLYIGMHPTGGGNKVTHISMPHARISGNATSFPIYHTGNLSPLTEGGTHGTVTFNDWVRTSGATGWYNTTYGGGMYMADSTWVRVSHTKKFFVDNTASDAIYTAGGVRALGNVQGATFNGYAISGLASNNTIVLRDATGDISCRLFRPEYADQTDVYGAIAFRGAGGSGTDNYLRFCNSPSAVRTWIGAPSTAVATTSVAGLMASADKIRANDTARTKSAAEITLWSGEAGANTASITVSQSLYNFPAIRFEGINADRTIAWSYTMAAHEWLSLCNGGYNISVGGGAGYYWVFKTQSASGTTLTRHTNNAYLTRIVGIN